jgi:membrane protein YqaA with SNARE-associated domain
VDTASLPALGTVALWSATFAFAFISGVIPFVLNIEIYLLAVATMTDASPVAIVGLATAGQSLAKLLLYLVGKGALNIKWVKRAAASKAAGAFEKRPGSGLSIVALSSLVGFPPLYGVSLVAGTLRLPLAAFTILIIVGRAIRFGAVYLAPQLFR